MTDPTRPDELTQIHTTFEAAARLYCQKIGHDPDQLVQIAPAMKGRIIGAPPSKMAVARWRLVAEELFDLSTRMVALRDARAAQVAPVGVPQ